MVHWIRLLVLGLIGMLSACGGGDGGIRPGPNPPPPPPSGREWTVMVFMAADNNLAIDGIFDIDEMEEAGVNSSVQVVVEAEFNKETVAKSNNCDFKCFNRPNWNTFRYAVKGEGSKTTGPNGPAEDIGNRDMSSPGELKNFIDWAKQTYPANRYLLVLWNHGGGFAGLLEDATSNPGKLMNLTELKQGLEGNKLDIIDFDMCLMAGYEGLSAVQGKTDYAVFSEEVVPGEGNPYTAILKALYANPKATSRSVAQLFVEQFHNHYQAKQDRSSTTKSAYELAGFTQFENSLNALADSLRTNLGTLRTSLQQAASASQSYSYPQFKDLVDLLDKLRPSVNATLQGQIDALKTQATGSFRVANKFRNGSGKQSGGSVDRSTGLHIVLPSLQDKDTLTDNGPLSFSAYQAQFTGKSWTNLLQSYLNGGGGGGGGGPAPTTPTVDQGAARFQGFLAWEEATQEQSNVDLLVLEPSGKLFIPALGSVTPNGTFTADSLADNVNFEGYTTNRFVEKGRYYFFALLWDDPENLSPLYDVFYRNLDQQNFQRVYGAGNEPRLSFAQSWLNDPNPTLEKVAQGLYTDFQYAAYLDKGVAPQAVGQQPGVSAQSQWPPLTPAQLQTLRQLKGQRERRQHSLPQPFGKQSVFEVGQ